MTCRLCFTLTAFVSFPAALAIMGAIATGQQPFLRPPAPPAPTFEEKMPQAATGPSRADIPAGLAPGVKKVIENTFSENAREREQAAKKLGEMRSIAAVPFLIRLLGDEGQTDYDRRLGNFNTVSDSAYDSLVKIGEPAVEPSLAALRRSIGESRQHLIMLLGRIKDSRAIKALTGLLEHPNPEVRRCVVNSLYRWTDPRLVEPLIGALNDKDSEVRSEATRTLKEFHDPRVVSPLIEALRDKEERVRWGAARALGEQGGRRAATVLLEVVHCATEEPSVRCAAARSLGKLGEPRAVGELLAVVRDRSLPESVRRGAVDGLGASKDRRFVQPLMAFTRDLQEASNMRAQAVRAIADLEDDRAMVFLTEIARAKTEDDHVRCWAAMCAVKITKGAIEDVDIVVAIEGPYGTENSMAEVADAARAKDEAVHKVAENGKTESVRTAAKALLAKWNRGYSPASKPHDNGAGGTPAKTGKEKGQKDSE